MKILRIKSFLIIIASQLLQATAIAGVPKYMIKDGDFQYYVGARLAAKAICMEKVTEIPKGNALTYFENVILEDNLSAKTFYFQYIKYNQEAFNEFAVDTANIVLEGRDKLKSRNKPYNNDWWDYDNCEEILAN